MNSSAATSSVASPALLLPAVLTSFLLVLLAGSTVAQQVASGTIEGRVITHRGETVPDARVRLVDLRRTADTAADGTFSFAGLAAGSYLLEAESRRFGKTVRRVELGSHQTVAVDLVIDLGTHTEEIVVTASAEARSQLELSSPTTIVSGEELALQMQPSLGETLSQQPGINSTYFGPGASRPVVRGITGDRVRILDSGLGVGDASSTSPDHAVAIDPLSAERIEVVRGPSTLLYGSSAIGGVVNVLSERIPQSRAESRLSGTVDLRTGSVAEERSGAIKLDGGSGNWAWHADVLGRKTGDYDIPGFAQSRALRLANAESEAGAEATTQEHGTLSNSDVKTQGGGAGVTYFAADRGFLGVAFSGLSSNYGIPGGDNSRIDSTQRRVDLDGQITRPCGLFQGLRLRLGSSRYAHDEIEAGGEVGTTFRNNALEGRLELVQKRRGKLRGSWGAQFRSRELEAIGEEAFIPPNKTTSLSIFAFQEVEFSSLSFQLGLRYESQDNSARVAAADVTLPKRSFSGVSSSLGAVWRPLEGYAVAASLARSTKLPNSEELYTRGAHVATRSFEFGNPNLGKETSTGADLSLRKTSGHVNGELTLFLNRFDDFIFQRFTGEEEDNLPVVVATQADATFYGAEFQSRFGLYESGSNHLDLRLFGDLVRAELDSGPNLPRIPAARYGLGLHFHNQRFHARAEVHRTTDQDRIADHETTTDGHTLINASFGYRFFAGNQVYDLLLRATNLSNAEARSHTSFLKDRVPLPGRGVSLGLRLTF